MSKYLTVPQYKRYDDGVALSGITDVSLALVISRAEAAIDAHMGFDEKRGGFEPHQVMIQSRFDERTRKSFLPNYQVPVRNVTRYRIQVSNVASSGAGFFATISPADCVINNDGGYIEIVPLQAVTYSLSPVLLQLGLKPPVVEMDCEVGYYIPIFGEQLIDSGNHQLYYATSGFWASSYNQQLASQPNQLPAAPPVVYVNGSIQNASTYSVNYQDGSILFNSQQMPTVTVSADYAQTIPDYVTEATVIQTSHLLAVRNLNRMGMYSGLYQLRSGEQQISFPRVRNVSDEGRSTATALCDEAAALLSRYEGYSIA